jgi:hypothetical protein
VPAHGAGGVCGERRAGKSGHGVGGSGG